MSDFKIIKCPKCNASTAQLLDKPLFECPQCNHQLIKLAPKKTTSRISKSSGAIKSTSKNNFGRNLVLLVIFINILRHYFSN